MSGCYPVLKWIEPKIRVQLLSVNVLYSNMTSFFRFRSSVILLLPLFVNKRASYLFGIISLAHAPVNVADFFIDSIICNPNNADRGRSIIRVT
jgi:hypothetical protein